MSTVTIPPINSAHPLDVASNGDTYFVGHDLEAAKRLVLRDRWAKVERHDGHVYVSLCDDETLIQEAEWGSGATEEVAWRFALGAAFGPIDTEYDESRLIAWLQVLA